MNWGCLIICLDHQQHAFRKEGSWDPEERPFLWLPKEDRVTYDFCLGWFVWDSYASPHHSLSSDTPHAVTCSLDAGGRPLSSTRNGNRDPG